MNQKCSLKTSPFNKSLECAKNMARIVHIDFVFQGSVHKLRHLKLGFFRPPPPSVTFAIPSLHPPDYFIEDESAICM